MIAFVYQKLLHGEISKKRSKIKEFSLIRNFAVNLKAFELVQDCLILYFPVVFAVYNICRKFQLARMNVSKVIAWRKLKKSLLDLKILTFLKFWPCYLEKMNFFPSKNHLAFLTLERYDIEMTNTKISDKNMLPGGGGQGPEGRLLKSWNFVDFGVKCWVSKKFPSSKFYCLW